MNEAELREALRPAIAPTTMASKPLDRSSLARDILLKLIEAENTMRTEVNGVHSRYITVQFVPAPPDGMARVSVAFADALLAELAKGKEG